MIGTAIVAIPREDDPVWKISSEKIPHLTLCFLGPTGPNFPIDRVSSYVQHVADTSMCRFGLQVDHRDKLGPDDADVLIFQEDMTTDWLNNVRSYLLQDRDIRIAYNSVVQFPTWIPHLTLGTPDKPAHPDNREWPGISWINFDKIAIWTSDFEGPEFLLKPQTGWDPVRMSDLGDKGASFVEHHGVKGMKWGVRQDKGHVGERAKTRKIARLDRKFNSRASSPSVAIKIWNGATKSANDKLNAINDKPKYKNADFTRDTPLRRAYYSEGKKALIDSLEASANSFGTNASGTKKYGVIENSDESWDVIVRDVKHDDSPAVEFSVILIRNETGHITGFKLADDGSKTVEHFGVRGMHWGTRKSATKTRERTKSSGDHATAKKLEKHKRDTLTNKEISTIVKRKELESRYSQVNPSKFKKGEKVVKSIVGVVGTVSSLIALSGSPAGKTAIAAAKKILANR